MRPRKKSPLGLLALTFNLRKNCISDEHEEYDDIETIYALKRELCRYARAVVLLEQDENIFRTLKELRPDYVFNICEGVGPYRSRESQLPAILEMLNIKHFGSDAVSLGMALDKYLSYLILKSSALPSAVTHLVNSAGDLKKAGGVSFDKGKRYIIKPRWEGSSKGIFNASVVSSLKEAEKLANKIISRYKQPAVIEEFLEGAEITVGIAGNQDARVLGMMQITHKTRDCKNFIYGLETKRNWKEEIVYLPETSIKTAGKKQIAAIALKAFKAFELRDAARIDFRLDGRGNAKIIDINPLPGLSPVYSDLPIMFKLKKKTYRQLMDIIIQASFRRCGFIK